MTVEPVDRDSSRSALTLVPGPAVAVLAGALTGGFAAWAYYDDVLRPVAHVFGLWIALVAVLSARRDIRAAVARSAPALMSAVLAFYLGKKVMYGIDYPGMPYSLDVGTIGIWLTLAVLAGTVLGAAFSFIGSSGHRGAAATAGAIGLLIADAYRRSAAYPDEATVVLTVAVIGAAAVLAVGPRSPQSLLRTVVWAVPLTPLALLLVSAPDALEQRVFTGGF